MQNLHIMQHLQPHSRPDENMPYLPLPEVAALPLVLHDLHKKVAAVGVFGDDAEAGHAFVEKRFFVCDNLMT